MPESIIVIHADPAVVMQRKINKSVHLVRHITLRANTYAMLKIISSAIGGYRAFYYAHCGNHMCSCVDKRHFRDIMTRLYGYAADVAPT